jgi:hypothetical protein
MTRTASSTPSLARTTPAPITRASGKHRVVLARYARNKRLADTCFLWAFAPSPRAPAPESFMTNGTRTATPTTAPSEPSPTASSASSTAAFDTAPLRRTHRLGPPKRCRRFTATNVGCLEQSLAPGLRSSKCWMCYSIRLPRAHRLCRYDQPCPRARPPRPFGSHTVPGNGGL